MPLSPAAMLGRLFSVVSIVRGHSKIKKHIKYSAQHTTSLPSPGNIPDQRRLSSMAFTSLKREKLVM